MHTRADFERADSSAHSHYTVPSVFLKLKQLTALDFDYFVDAASAKHHENGKQGLEDGDGVGVTSSRKERKMQQFVQFLHYSCVACWKYLRNLFQKLSQQDISMNHQEMQNSNM